MGPVAFEAIEVGNERDHAMQAASVLRAADIRADLLEPDDVGRPYRLMVRTQDVPSAVEAIAGLSAKD